MKEFRYGKYYVIIHSYLNEVSDSKIQSMFPNSKSTNNNNLFDEIDCI